MRIQKTTENRKTFSAVWVVLFMVWSLVCNAADEPLANAEAMALLEHERAVAEDMAALLKEFKQHDLKVYAEGVQLYADARGEFNGLIEQIKHGLIAEEHFEQSAEFTRRLKIAVNRRVAFTRHVDEKLIQVLPSNGTKGLPSTLFADPAKLINAITEAAKGLWQEYRKVKDSTREEMLTQLEEVKWSSFSKAGG